MALTDFCDENSFCVPIYIPSLNGTEDYAAFAIIDTGATHTLIPLDVVESLGLPQIRTQHVETANGVVQMPVIYAEIQVGDNEPIHADMLGTENSGLVAIGVDLTKRLGLLIPQYLNP